MGKHIIWVPLAILATLLAVLLWWDSKRTPKTRRSPLPKPPPPSKRTRLPPQTPPTGA